jgi:hypothetical protein
MLRLISTCGQLHSKVTYFYKLETLGGVVSFHLRRICLITDTELGCQFVDKLPENEFLVKSLRAIPAVANYVKKV